MFSVMRRSDTETIFEVLDGPWVVLPRSPSGQVLGELHAWVEASSTANGEVTSDEVVARRSGSAVRWLGPGVSWEVSRLDVFAAEYAKYRKATITVTGDIPEDVNPQPAKPAHQVYGTKDGGFHEEGWYQVVETHKDDKGKVVTTTAWIHLWKPRDAPWRETLHFPVGFLWVAPGVTWKITWYDTVDGEPDLDGLKSMSAVITLT